MFRLPAVRRSAFTLVEMLVVIGIILALAALAAAFLPRINDSQKMSRAVDSLQQWLLTAKMRAKRDGLATGLRFVQAPGDAAGVYSQFQYVQQPGPLAGGWLVGPPQPPGSVPAPSPPFPPGQFLIGGYLASAAAGVVAFGNVDLTLGMFPGSSLWNQWLVQPGDYLEVNGGGVYLIGGYSPTSPQNTLLLGVPTPTPPPAPPIVPTITTPSPYDTALALTNPTMNYRILRQPRILIGEEPLTLPANYAVNFGSIPGYLPATSGSNVLNDASGYPEILFAPLGTVVGTNAANAILVISVWDTTDTSNDPNRVGVVGLRARTHGFHRCLQRLARQRSLLFRQDGAGIGL